MPGHEKDVWQLKLDTKGRGSQLVYLTLEGTGQKAKPFVRTLKIDEKIDVEMSWANGTLLVRVGNSETQQFPLPFPVAIFDVLASTGEINLDPLIFGTIR